MMVVVLVIVAAAIVAAAVVAWWSATNRELQPGDGTSGGRPADPWLVEAGGIARAGLLVVEDLGSVGSDEPCAVPGESMVAESTARLAELTHRLAALATTAPTTMDGRVCRNAAVRTQSLVDALRGHSTDPTVVTGSITFSRADVLDRRVECEHALHDLADHVHLL